jgi:hypothetical protein
LADDSAKREQTSMGAQRRKEKPNLLLTTVARNVGHGMGVIAKIAQQMVGGEPASVTSRQSSRTKRRARALPFASATRRGGKRPRGRASTATAAPQRGKSTTGKKKPRP